ncbi:unnamed protein product [Didymodactylos carnosus]|uniref:Rap-GAP domain-containing protein n=1 Tax=Didymodactylos carnosus TaxID=1234261 RepID=A0A8S2FZK4_9BILA|nr:unnamed protein product [Didymodactylos carnosus]CAF4404747.1 unnamed protein product [Didymodactylos carnosus]
MYPLIRFEPVGDYKANDKIYRFDKRNDERQYCKIGVYYQKLGQDTENAILSNRFQSKYMENFLNLIAGEKVRLKGFKNYKGDLDVKEDLHGLYSYHTIHEQHEIMFNVAPMIPSSIGINGEYVERKALPGNSFVCIIFQDPGADFKPDIMAGRVNQVYITVQPTNISLNIDTTAND